MLWLFLSISNNYFCDAHLSNKGHNKTKLHVKEHAWRYGVRVHLYQNMKECVWRRKKIIKPIQFTGDLGLSKYLLSLNLWKYILRRGIFSEVPKWWLMPTEPIILEGCLMKKNEDLEGKLTSVHFIKIRMGNSLFFRMLWNGICSLCIYCTDETEMLFPCVLIHSIGIERNYPPFWAWLLFVGMKKTKEPHGPQTLM